MHGVVNGLHRFTGYLALAVVLLLVTLGPVSIFLAGLFAVLLGPLWVGLLLWFFVRAMLVDLWSKLPRL